MAEPRAKSMYKYGELEIVLLDSDNYAVSKKVRRKDKEGNEQDQYRHDGYYHTIEAAATALARKIADTEANNLSEWVETAKAVLQDITSVFNIHHQETP